MHNRKSRITAILILITALLVIAFMIAFPIWRFNSEKDDNIIAAYFSLIFTALEYSGIYLCGIPYAITAIIFGVKMLLFRSRKKLLSLNVRMLIASCVLFPFFGMGIMNVGMANPSVGGFQKGFAIVVTCIYIVSIVAEIVTIILLKHTPDEDDSPTE